MQSSISQLPTVEECIASIEATDYKLVRRGKVFGEGAPLYVFRSPSRPACFREMSFTTTELRDAFRHGF